MTDKGAQNDRVRNSFGSARVVVKEKEEKVFVAPERELGEAKGFMGTTAAGVDDGAAGGKTKTLPKRLMDTLPDLSDLDEVTGVLS